MGLTVNLLYYFYKGQYVPESTGRRFLRVTSMKNFIENSFLDLRSR